MHPISRGRAGLTIWRRLKLPESPEIPLKPLKNLQNRPPIKISTYAYNIYYVKYDIGAHSYAQAFVVVNLGANEIVRNKRELDENLRYRPAPKIRGIRYDS